MYSTEFGINFFGSKSNKKIQTKRLKIVKKNIKNFKNTGFFLLDLLTQLIKVVLLKVTTETD